MSPFSTFAAPETAPLVIVLPGARSQGREPSPTPRIASGKMWISSACRRPSGSGMAATPTNVLGLMSLIEAFSTVETDVFSSSLTVASAPRAS